MSVLMTEEQQLAADGIRKLMRERIEPEFLAYREQAIPRQQMQNWMMQLVEFGLVTAPQGTRWGGMGSDWVTHLRLFEEVAASSLDIALPSLINVVASDLLDKLAPEHLQQRYLPGLMRGELFASVAISEPDVGSDVASVKTRARRDGDDWIINGEKTWITNGEYSDFLVCTCNVEGGGLTHILLDRQEHGYEVAGIPKIALNGQSTSQIFLSDVRVPVSNTIGEIGRGLKNTLTLFERARCHMAAWGYSIARRAMEEAIVYSTQRTQHGKPIAGHQLIADKLAVMATEIDAARLLTLRAGEMIDKGLRCDSEAAMAKWYGTEIAVRATREALQIHGGNGVTKEFIVERLAREAIIGPIPDGTTEIQRLLIARNLTGVQAFR
ncbi:MAG: acyl-CoA dehydrogenase family protein [Panacagrimonas sp.]